MIRCLLRAGVLIAVAAVCGHAQSVKSLPEYKPEKTFSDLEVIRSWGSDDMAGLMKSWLPQVST